MREIINCEFGRTSEGTIMIRSGYCSGFNSELKQIISLIKSSRAMSRVGSQSPTFRGP